MCLLDGVLDWGPQEAVCVARSHRDPAHPLRAQGRLGIAAGIEYAAQAMAVHGVLLAGDGQALGVGYLTSVRQVRTHVGRLDDIGDELRVRVVRLSGDDALILYQFDVFAAGRCLLEGRASVVLDASLT